VDSAQPPPTQPEITAPSRSKIALALGRAEVEPWVSMTVAITKARRSACSRIAMLRMSLSDAGVVSMLMACVPA